MKKGWLFVLLATIIIMPLTLAAESQSNEDKVYQAYQCLRSEIGNRSSAALSLQEATFSILALGNVDKAKTRLDSEKSTTQDCWPKSSCKIKETAQALVATRALGRSTEGIENYLISKNTSAIGLTWLVQIDVVNHQQSECSISYDTTTRNIQIGADMKLSGDTESCLSISSSGYWLQISQSCVDKKFDISCSNDFVSSILYTKSGSDTIYVSPDTHSASGSGHTFEEIKSKCFKTSSNTCDYEGSLWAAIALQQAGRDVSAFIPYLVAMAEDNKQYLPSAFLYKLTNSQDQYSNLVQSQVQSKYWQAPSSQYGKFYDTALAISSLTGSGSGEIESAKDYLLGTGLQTSKGCWNNNNIRDTAFILYAAWPDLSGYVSNSGGNNSGSSTLELCESAGVGFCGGRYTCLDSDVGGTILTNYLCPLFGDVCCSKDIRLKTCSEQGGTVCSSNRQCSESEVPSSDGSCCVGTCEIVNQNTNVCENSGNTCKSYCDLNTETETSDTCPLIGDVCCQTTTSSGGETESSSNSWIWITILIVLILLVVLAIIFRNRLQLWFAKFKKGRASSTPIISRRPPFPPSFPSSSYSRQPAPARRASTTDKEMEETMHKLREMSK